MAPANFSSRDLSCHLSGRIFVIFVVPPHCFTLGNAATPLCFSFAISASSARFTVRCVPRIPDASTAPSHVV